MVEIIAEVANAHEGDPNRAINIALRAVGAGAHAVKFQIYFGADLLTEDHPRFEHFCKQSFSKEDWIGIISKTKKSGAKVYADVFGLDALVTALECDVDGLKIHSSDLSNAILTQSCARAGLPIFLAVGGSTLREITDAINNIRSINSQQKIIIMFGYQAYPTKIESNSISKIDILKKTFGNEVDYGFMDHTDGDIDEALSLPSLALAFGCTYIEKHVTDNRALKGIDYYSSLEDDQFEKFVSHCISSEKYLGSMTYDMCTEELHYRNTVKKIWVANKDLEEGHFIEYEDLVMKRSPNFGVQDMTRLMGKKLIKSVTRDTPITRHDVHVKVLAVVVARSKSTRLPGKATLPIASVGALEHLFRRLDFAKAQHSITSLAFCTTMDVSDDELAKLAGGFGVSVFRGDVDNVLKRMSLALEAFDDHDLVLRITGDDILCDPKYLAKTVNYHLATGADYTDAKSLPSGTEVEVFDASVLRYILSHALDTSGTEYLTNYITDNQHLFSCHSLPVASEHTVKARLTLDTLEDYSVIGRLIKTFAEEGKEFDYSMDDIVEYFTKNPTELNKNQEIIQRKIPLQFDTSIAVSKSVLKPLVTVYIVNFNYAKYLERSIESVLAQTFKNIQLLIIDDGSSDDSQRILDYYENIYGIEVVRNTNKGLTASNNSALKLAKGKYITRLDADDFFHEDAIRQLVSPLEDNASIAAVFPDYAVVDQEGNVLHYESRNDFKKDVDLFDSPAHGACTLIRSEMLKEVGGYNENYFCQDGWDAWLKLLQLGSVQNISLPLFFYRQHSENMTRDKRRLYRTRSIILADHNRLINKSRLSSLAIIPVRDTSSQPFCLRQFRGSNLLSIAIKQAFESDRISAVVVSTNNSAVIKALSESDLDIVIHDRRESSLNLDREVDSVVTSVLAHNEISKRQFDCISVINYEYPFRDKYVIDQSVDILQAFNADSSMTVIPLNYNLYQNSGKGLQPDSKNTNLRHERESRFAEIGGVHSVMATRFNANNQIHQDRVATITIDEQSAFKIESDFLLALTND
jgi:sialic acid synthase SpsE/spore coat polysaccharide biosynthesis protein SpsF (cytidylyltransferase family)/CMP-N-acetylneuraminic acid synthetase